MRSRRQEYDRYGNMTCVQESNTNGPCPQWAYNASTNRLTTSGFTYDAAGDVTADGLHTYQWGAEGRVGSVHNGSTWVFTYNPRLEPSELKASSSAGTAMDLVYSFVDGNGHNNGNVIGITNNKDTTRSQSFAYDQVNRISSAQTSSTSGSNCWGETYGYDQWANLTSIGAVSGYGSCVQEMLNVSANANNQLTATGFSYDGAGNMLGDGLYTYLWNAESQIKTATGVNYTYDGDGNRVEKSNAKLYWYGAGSEILDESDLSGNITDEYVFFGGKHVAHRVVSGGSIYYYAEDFLGTSRVVTTSSGVVCYEADFYPYGGERVITNTCAQNYKFEGKERDTETQNDNFGARYYTSRLGRWFSPDWSAVPAPVPYANLANPQTLNLYAMVQDNPETFADLDGHLLGQPPWYGRSGSSPLQNTAYLAEASWAAAVAYTMYAAEVSASQAPQTAAQAQQQMSLSSKGLDFIKSHEGYSDTVYKDSAGNPTIGYGHLIKAGENFDKGITKDQATALLAQDVKGAVGAVNSDLKVKVSQTQFDALVDVTYNLGGKNLANSTLFSNINAGKAVIERNFTDYNHAGGRVVPGLTIRRTDEFNLFSKGDYGGP